ncbi:hypothetical protein TSUD_38980 [Trifolium subterraneum]|uniref:Uncharacterized protein n=1 Tax=Trifolium subterraneum TaxID=3900 RepID=A0A2Z6MD72_TRISU|nr:hypothetical protein TSUD_38980 [Trifolium subterraneum]
MDRKKNTNDFFSYVRFEASGDSEADNNCDDFNMNMDWEIARSLVYDDDDNDDAMSCSYDENDNDEHDDDEEEISEYDDEEIRDDVVYGTSYCEEDDDDDEVNNDEQYEKKKKKKSYVSNFDSGGRESMDEMEKNRRFWEACLAS